MADGAGCYRGARAPRVCAAPTCSSRENMAGNLLRGATEFAWIAAGAMASVVARWSSAENGRVRRIAPSAVPPGTTGAHPAHPHKPRTGLPGCVLT